jgi:hypothetical protein
MNSVENLMSTQLNKLFRIFKSSIIQSLNIFGAKKNFHFEFTNFCWVWILEENLNRARPTCQRPISVLPPWPHNRTHAAHHGAGHHAHSAERHRTSHHRSSTPLLHVVGISSRVWMPRGETPSSCSSNFELECRSMMPGTAVSGATIFLPPLHHRPPFTVDLWPLHDGKKDRKSTPPYLGYSFLADVHLFAPPSRSSPLPSSPWTRDPVTPNRFPVDPLSSPATPCRAPRRQLAGFGRRSHRRQRGNAFPCFQFRAKSLEWARPFCNRLGGGHCRSSPSA